MSGVTIIGDYPVRPRFRTGIWSLDVALSHGSKLGMPMRTIVILYGYRHSGKSTLAYYLAGKQQETGIVSLCDIEGLDIDYLPFAFGQAGYQGSVKIVDEMGKKKKPRPHADMINEMATHLLDESIHCAIFDSVSAYVPVAEQQGEVGDAIVGRRAKDMAYLARRLAMYLRNQDEDKMAYVINHPYQKIGGHGHTIAGGTVMGNMAGVMIQMYRKTGKLIKSREEDHFVAEGKVEKLRYGGKGRKFQVAFLAGIGVHAGISNVLHAVDLGLINKKSTGHMSIDDVSIGRIGELVDLALAGEDEPFDRVDLLLEDHYYENISE